MSYGYVDEDIKSEHTDSLESIGRELEIIPVDKGTRFINFIVDRVIIFIISFAIGAVLGLIIGIMWPENLSYFDHVPFLHEVFFGVVINFLYYFILETTTGQSIGKMLTVTKVLTEDGEKPDTKAIAIRSVCRMIPFEPFSFFGSTDLGWHDTISKTIVVKNK